MNRRLFAWKASGILAALGLCSKSNADIVDDANYKPPAPKTKVKIKEIGVRDHGIFDTDYVWWNISYEVTFGDGTVISRDVVSQHPRTTRSGKGLNIDLDLS